MKAKIKSQLHFHLILLFLLPQVLSATIINVPGDASTIQAGITASSNGDTVLVQPNTYYQNINFNGKNIMVASLFLTTGDASYISQTIINGNNNNSVVKFNSGESNNAVLSGFTITNGSAYYGAGIYCYQGSSPTLDHLVITGNHGYVGDSYGGGICFMSETDAICSNLTITDNSANEGGGIFFHDNGNATMSYITMSENTSAHGGAMQISYSNPVIDHGVFYANNSPFGGAVYVFNYSSPQFINCTFTQNEADYGGAFYCSDLQCVPIITNCILWDDVSLYDLEIFAMSTTFPPLVTYSDVQDGAGEFWFGIGCIEDDPIFVDPGNSDFHLTFGSPCIDTGDPASPLDPDGSQADIGAYYFEEVQLPGMATNPIPENNANGVETDLILYWVNSENTETIDLYFGTENPPVTPVLENVPAIELFGPGQLETESTYYWQVDCKNEAGTVTGEVWSFTTGINTNIQNIIQADKEVLVSPNPVKDNLNFSCTRTIQRIKIFNYKGGLVLDKEVGIFSGQINLTGFTPGIYIFLAETEKTISISRIIKQ